MCCDCFKCTTRYRNKTTINGFRFMGDVDVWEDGESWKGFSFLLFCCHFSGTLKSVRILFYSARKIALAFILTQTQCEIELRVPDGNVFFAFNNFFFIFSIFRQSRKILLNIFARFNLKSDEPNKITDAVLFCVLISRQFNSALLLADTCHGFPTHTIAIKIPFAS